MSIKKPNTKKRHEKIYEDVLYLVNTQKANSVWDACLMVARKMRLSQPTVSMAFYNFRREKQILEKTNSNK